MASPSLTLSTLFMSPKLITEHVLSGSSSAVKGPHCCTCKSELKTSSFSSSVWCRVPGGSPGRAWRSSGSISQWTPQLKDPQWSHTTPGTGVPCFAGWALPPLSAKRLDQSLPWRPWQTPVSWGDRDFAQKQVNGGDLPPFFWGASGSLHFIPWSHCLQWHLWALHLISLSFALGTGFCWSFTYFVGSEGIPHDHLPILNESTEKEKLRPSRDMSVSLLPSLEKTPAHFLSPVYVLLSPS